MNSCPPAAPAGGRARAETAKYVQLTLEAHNGFADALTGAVMKHFHFEIAIALVVCSSLAAQTKAPLRLSLAQAMERALAENPQVQIANLELAASQQDRKIARSALLPQASLRADDTIRRINTETLIGRQVPAIGQVSGPFQAISAGPAFSMPLFDLRLWKHYSAAKDRVEASRADAQTRREETSLLVVSQYLGVLRAQASVDASKSRVNVADALLGQAKALHQAGVATRVDEVRAEVRLRQEQQALIVAQTDVQTALFALARLLNVPPDEEIEASDTAPFSETPEIPSDATIQTAIHNRPELAAAGFRKLTAESERSAAAAASLPSLGFEGVWDEAGRNLPGMIPAWTYQVSLSVPLFTGGRLSAERERARIHVRQAAQQETDTRNRIAEQV
ncbi:MAG TPA: TolC family protein, partial [Bryobacteraceae bacterium]|nr:TolC family protein [Bryobacteraceae bacterium]